MYKLRNYQITASNKGVWYLRNYDKPFVLVLATGAGKSLVIAEICHQLDEPVLVLQPSREILEQNYTKLQSYGITDISIYSASMNSKEISKYTYATIGSIYRKPELFTHFKYVIIDECHLVGPKNLNGMYMKFLTAIGCKNVCGLTATPYRIQQKYSRDSGQLTYTAHLKMINRIGYPTFWKNIAYKVETADLINQGYLCPIVYRQDHEADMEQLEINSTGADFTTESLERFWNDRRLKKLAAVIKKIDANCQRNLIFMPSVRAGERAQALLEALKVSSTIVTANTSQIDRKQAITQFREGKVRHMINVGVFTTGFDVPEIDCITLARPTMSLALYYQMVGRGVRIDPNRPEKVLRVYDLAGVVRKLGRIETIRVVKEDPPNHWKDRVISERGDLTEKPLFTYLVKKNPFKTKEVQNDMARKKQAAGTIQKG